MFKKFFEPLYLLNDLRFDYIFKMFDFKNKNVLDVGCGNGLLSEKIALHGGFVTGLDKSKALIDFATKSALKKNITNINYFCCNLFDFNCSYKFNLIIVTEVLEHLSNRFLLFNFLNKLSISGTVIFLSSVDISFLSYLKVIFFGEFLLKKIYKNTHNYKNFLSIYDLNYKFFNNSFKIVDIKYLNFNFFFSYSNLNFNNDINYIIKIVKL